MSDTISQEMDRHVSSKLDQNSIVIDIGAYNGDRSIDIMNISRGNPNNYYLIEACPINYKQIKNRNTGVNIFNIAISDKDGLSDFYIVNHEESEGTSQANSLFKEFVESKKWSKEFCSIHVPIFTLDKFVFDNGISRIDFLKINCEGGEYKIFRSKSIDFLDITNIIYLQMHGKIDLFNSEKIVREKIRINDILLSKNFRLIMGNITAEIFGIKSHICQLWERV